METIVQGGNSQNPYKQFTYAIQPQQSETIFYALNYFRILELTGDPANLRIRFGSSGSFSEFVGAGIGFELPQAVERVDITNTSTTDVLTVTLAVAIGRIDDNRLNVSGNVNVVNAAGTELNTHDSDVLSETTAILAMMQNATLQRKSLTPQGANSYVGTAGTGLVTLFTPAANANGAILRLASLIATSSAAYGGLFADTAAPASATDNTKNCIGLVYSGASQQLRDIYITAGNGLYFYSSGSMPVSANWDLI